MLGPCCSRRWGFPVVCCDSFACFARVEWGVFFSSERNPAFVRGLTIDDITGTEATTQQREEYLIKLINRFPHSRPQH